MYANPRFSGFELPQNDVSTGLFECYRDGKRVAEHTNGDVASQAQGLWDSHFSSTHGDVTLGNLFNVEVNNGKTSKPVFMSLDLETPLGFASFLANSSHHRKVFIPSRMNMSKILKSVSRQKSTDIVCDKEFFEIELPEKMAEEYKAGCSSVESAIVAGEGSASSNLFEAKATVIDPLSF